MIALITLLALSYGLLRYLVTPKEYRATALIQIERKISVPLQNISDAWLDNWFNSEYYPTQYRLLTSRGLAERVVANLQLDQDPAFNPGGGGAPRAANAAADDAALGGMAQRLLAGLSVAPLQGTQLVDISYTSESPELAAKVANGVVDAYIDWGIETRTSVAGKASSFYAQQIEALKQELSDKERQLQAYGKRADIVSLDPSTNVVLKRLQALNDDYIQAISARIAAEVHLRALQSANGERAADLVQDPTVVQERSDLLDMERDYASKLSVYKPEWPAMVALKGKIDQTRAALTTLALQALEREKATAQADYDAAVRKEQSLVAELQQVKAENRELSSASVEYSNLQIEINTKRKLLDQLLQSQSETDVTSRLQATRESNVRIVDKALVPGGAFRPSLSRNLSLAGGGGFAGGIALVLLLFYMDRTLKSPDEVERLLDLPLLATVPDVTSGKGKSLLRRYGYGYGYGYGSGYGYGYGQHRKRSRPRKAESASPAEEELQIELLPHSRPRLAASEAYRSLRTALLLSTARELKVVSVTSAVPGEGKTSTATNLAVVLSQLPKRVLLVDGDLRKPRLHKVFSGHNRLGLVNYLTHGAPVEDVVFQSKVPNLWISPSGPIPPNPSELVASERMAEFVAWARERFDIVIFDSAPSLAVTDAILLGRLADGVVLCLRAGYVQKKDAKLCRDRLLQSELRMLGVVLNCDRGVGGTYRGRYRGGYAYEAAYGQADEVPEKAAS